MSRWTSILHSSYMIYHQTPLLKHYFRQRKANSSSRTLKKYDILSFIRYSQIVVNEPTFRRNTFRQVLRPIWPATTKFKSEICIVNSKFP